MNILELPNPFEKENVSAAFIWSGGLVDLACMLRVKSNAPGYLLFSVQSKLWKPGADICFWNFFQVLESGEIP